ncbi:Zn-dependent alcohol dehydrogenases (ISS) [Pochonia chlamydosporia 170]|uniref:Zn-dependent alcohol dehydrogenases (ISS) n=1 Tax=Pochonia chlamydosporia 170 TaxID=1380566 RepID=A0A179FSR7_METCM|nr:Zn-dependent alcohol dehydrogenases (ISS) [Pochonia chlamydosporia 170]OAQ68133.1 Zn-dependent alcohol dehydrogenases (ISS) [Pochonia chlamydosporia 170]
MAPRPIFTITHPRACSTAFERVFMTRRDELASQHEPFGDAYYFGPECVSERFKDDPARREESGVSGATFKNTFEGFDEVARQGKRVFIKDMAYYFFPAPGENTEIAASLGGGVEPNNPTVIPFEMLKQFHFTFLIRHPRRSVPSYWRCTIPPLREVSGFDYFLPSEMGYEELVRFFDWAIERGLVDKDRLTVVDADDLLDNPEAIIRKYCERTGLTFDPGMLKWNDADQAHAEKLFAKWNGFHDDALGNRELKGRSHAQKTLTVEAENKEWEAKYGKEAQQIIRETVDANIPYYEHLKQYCLKV